MLTNETQSDQFLNYSLVQHMSLHVCKNYFEPAILERVLYIITRH